MEFVSIDTWSLIFTWVNLFILFLIMKKLLFKPVMNMIESREKEVGEMYEKAEAAQKDAESMKDEYTKRLQDAQNEAGRIVNDAKSTAKQRSDEIISAAQTEAAAARSKAEREIEHERKAAAAELQSDIADIAVSIAKKVIEKDIDGKDCERLVEEYISGEGK